VCVCVCVCVYVGVCVCVCKCVCVCNCHIMMIYAARIVYLLTLRAALRHEARRCGVSYMLVWLVSGVKSNALQASL